MLENVLNKLNLASNVSELDAWNYAVTRNYKLMDYVRKLINEQLDEGIDADGDIIGEYSFAPEIISQGKKLEGDPFTLKDTGMFRGSIVVVGNKNDITIFANGDKTSTKKGRTEKVNLIDLYSVRIIELTDDNLLLLSDFIKTEYLIYLRNVLQIN